MAPVTQKVCVFRVRVCVRVCVCVGFVVFILCVLHVLFLTSFSFLCSLSPALPCLSRSRHALTWWLTPHTCTRPRSNVAVRFQYERCVRATPLLLFLSLSPSHS